MAVECFDTEGNVLPICFRTNESQTKRAVPRDANLLRTYIYVEEGMQVNETIWPYIQLASNDIGYSNYHEWFQAITLPAEHPYLAKLPDGTADTIEVDASGNVELVARVTQNSLTSWTGSGANYFICSISPNRADNSVLCSGGVKTLGSPEQGDIFVGTALAIVAYQPREGDTTAALNAKGLVFYYKLVTPKRYPLGKINLPALPESVSNIWTDAEITPRTTIEYTKDVNIAYDKLANAIVASVGGEANVS